MCVHILAPVSKAVEKSSAVPSAMRWSEDSKLSRPSSEISAWSNRRRASDTATLDPESTSTTDAPMVQLVL